MAQETPFWLLPQEEEEKVKITPGLVAKVLGSMGLRVAGPMGGGLAGAGLGTAIAGPIGTIPGAIIGGLLGGGAGEVAGQAAEQGDLTPDVNWGRVGVSSALGAIPGSWAVRAGRPALSTAIGAGLGYAGTAGNRMSDGKPIGEALNPQEFGLADWLGPVAGGVTGGLFGKFTTAAKPVNPPAKPDADVVPSPARSFKLQDGKLVEDVAPFPTTGPKTWLGKNLESPPEGGLRVVTPEDLAKQAPPKKLSPEDQFQIQEQAKEATESVAGRVSRATVKAVQDSLKSATADITPTSTTPRQRVAPKQVISGNVEGNRFVVTDPEVSDVLPLGVATGLPEEASEATTAALRGQANKRAAAARLSQIRTAGRQAARTEQTADLADLRAQQQAAGATESVLNKNLATIQKSLTNTASDLASLDKNIHQSRTDLSKQSAANTKVEAAAQRAENQADLDNLRQTAGGTHISKIAQGEARAAAEADEMAKNAQRLEEIEAQKAEKTPTEPTPTETTTAVDESGRKLSMKRSWIAEKADDADDANGTPAEKTFTSDNPPIPDKKTVASTIYTSKKEAKRVARATGADDVVPVKGGHRVVYKDLAPEPTPTPTAPKTAEDIPSTSWGGPAEHDEDGGAAKLSALFKAMGWGDPSPEPPKWSTPDEPPPTPSPKTPKKGPKGGSGGAAPKVTADESPKPVVKKETNQAQDAPKTAPEAPAAAPDRVYKGDAGQFFTPADEAAGYPKTKAALAGYSDEQLQKFRNEEVKASFNKVFGHNAKKMLKLVDEEIASRPNLAKTAGMKPAPAKPAAPKAEAQPPAEAASKVTSELKRVVDVSGAKTAKEVQDRVLATLNQELQDVSTGGGKITYEPSRAYGGREGRILRDGEVIATMNRYGQIKWIDEGSHTLVNGKRVETPSKFGPSPMSIPDAGKKPLSQISSAAVQRVSAALSKDAGKITIEIPGDGSFTINRNIEAIEEVISRVKRGGPLGMPMGASPWKGLGAQKPSPSKLDPLDGRNDPPPTKLEGFVERYSDPPKKRTFTASAFGAGQLEEMARIAKENPQFAGRLIGTLMGGVGGAALNEDNPLTGALLGGAAGFGLGSLAGKSNIDWKLLGRKIPNYYRGGLLSHPLSMMWNSAAGPYGSQMMGGLEQYLSSFNAPGLGRGTGDRAVGEKLLKELNPISWGKKFKSLVKEGFRDVAETERAESTYSGSPIDTIFSAPAGYMTTGDKTVRSFAKEAGMSDDMARRITMTNEPGERIPLAANIAHWGKGTNKAKQRSVAAQLMFPFRRTPANILESGLERTPGLGFIVNKMKDPSLRVPLMDQAVQQGLGATAGVVGYLAGLNTPEDTARAMKLHSLVSNLGGQYSLLTSVGFMIGQARRKGQRVSLQQVRDVFPLPAADPMVDLLEPTVNYLAGRPIEPKDLIPEAVVPKFLEVIVDGAKWATKNLEGDQVTNPLSNVPESTFRLQ